MANLQYVGARYVPKIYTNSVDPTSYEWESNTSYEALVMVQYRNTTYISRVPVPATVGEPAANPSYWCNMGSMSAQIQEYINIVSDLENQLDDLSDELHDYTSGHENAILVGNSYAAGSGGTAGHGWPYYFTQLTGFTTKIIAQNGGDFYDVGNNRADYPDMNYEQALSAYADTLTQAQREAVTLIIYGGGLNDREGTYNAVKARVISCINVMKTLFPHARQIVIPVSGTWFGEAGADLASVPGGGIRLITAYEAWIDGAGEAGVEVANYSKYWFYHRADYEGSGNDGYHLNEAGYELMAKYMISVYKGSDFAYIPFSGGQSYPSAITGRRTVRVTRSADGIVSMTGVIDVPEGEISSSTILVENLGAEFAPAVNQFVTAVFYGHTHATQFVCFLTVSAGGRVAIRGDYGSFGTNGGTIYINTTYKIDCPQPTF